jgi:hypothetical protein
MIKLTKGKNNKMNLIILRNDILLTRKWTYMPFSAIGDNYDS